VSAVPPRLVSVKLTPVGRSHTYLSANLPGGQTPRPGDTVVVQAEGGAAVGTLVRSIPQIVARRQQNGDAAPPRVVRIASHDDIVLRLKHEQREREAMRIAMLKIRERGLGMKVTRVEQLFDGSRLVFYFTADGRVDFRELVRELATEFRTRIEMRQIGVRDEAKMIGGYGTCGRPLCCTTFLTSFEPVSIKMAKQQDLSLNPSCRVCAGASSAVFATSFRTRKVSRTVDVAAKAAATAHPGCGAAVRRRLRLSVVKPKNQA
jgi:cell fate regulator YaaT (PSP1 superfamily)